MTWKNSADHRIRRPSALGR